MDELAVETTGLTKQYGDRVAVDALDLQVRQGEVLALLGPNGAGKTTAVEMLEGYRAPDAGTVRVLGHTPSKDRAWLDRIGIVAQTSTGLGSLTAREVVRSAARTYRNSRDPDQTLEAVGLHDHAKARIGTLSGGLRRRVDVALGIIGSPELLFLDEPTTGFDPQARRAFWDLIADLARRGTTIMLTTHYLDEAEHLADRVGIMVSGRLVALDTPQGLGGRDAEVATVSWDCNGEVREERTSSPTATVLRLQHECGGEVPGLSVRRPSLEDTYLRLINTHSTLQES